MASLYRWRNKRYVFIQVITAIKKRFKIKKICKNIIFFWETNKHVEIMNIF